MKNFFVCKIRTTRFFIRLGTKMHQEKKTFKYPKNFNLSKNSSRNLVYSIVIIQKKSNTHQLVKTHTQKNKWTQKKNSLIRAVSRRKRRKKTHEQKRTEKWTRKKLLEKITPTIGTYQKKTEQAPHAGTPRIQKKTSTHTTRCKSSTYKKFS